ncbi:hypothetical protein M1N06_03335 [Peptococcaceae bacterium]|nr:hypothetical protein [Peptococcaceae bacterium]
MLIPTERGKVAIPLNKFEVVKKGSEIALAVLLFIALDEMYRALLIEDFLEKIADLLSAITSLLLAAFFLHYLHRYT